MKICLVHNEYARPSGEETVVRDIRNLLQTHGHQVVPFTRSSAEIADMPLGKLRSFFTGIYSPRSRREFRRLLRPQQPDLVHIHNLFPLISPSIIPECTSFGIPVVMTTHNYRLVCPGGLHLVRGQLCEKCLGGREYRCLLKNCQQNIFKSLGYALRSYIARSRRFYLDHVCQYAALSEFQKNRLVAAGFPASRISVIPNMVFDLPSLPETTLGDYIAFVGRVSPEKGIETLLEAARACPDIPFKIAGDYHRLPDLSARCPANVELIGHLSPEKLHSFYAHCRFLVVPSLWYETFGLCTVEAMLHRKPVLASRIGSLPEIVADNHTGFLFSPGNVPDLTEKIRYLWSRPDLCLSLGATAREKALREYSPSLYYQRLIKMYEQASTAYG